MPWPTNLLYETKLPYLLTISHLQKINLAQSEKGQFSVTLRDMRLTFYLFTVLLFLSSCKDKAETVSPTRESITESVYASGVLKAKNQYQVYSTVNGLLQKIHVKEGDTVRKGTLLFTILNETSKLARENAQLAAELADIRANRTRLDELLLNIDLLKNKMLNDSLQLSRKRSLWAQNIGSKVELEQAELSYQNSKTTYESALLRYRDEKRRLEIASKQAQKNVQISRETESNFSITSNVDGKVYLLTSEEGEMVNTMTPLAVIGDANDYILELQVDEYDVTSIRPGQTVKVVMDSYKGEVFEAVVTKVNPIMNERTKTLTVEADFVTSPPSLYPNLTLEANIILQVKDDVLTLPRKFIIDDRLVINENGDTIPVTVGLKDYLKAEIVNGVDENDVLMLPE